MQLNIFAATRTTLYNLHLIDILLGTSIIKKRHDRVGHGVLIYMKCDAIVHSQPIKRLDYNYSL